MSVTATVIVPTHDHGPTLRYALASALAQTVTDLEVLVIGDAVPELTRELVGDIARRDERVRFFDRPKGERHGELYRHEVLADARGEIVCYLCDDDLWLPNHVELVREALSASDFVGAQTVHVAPSGEMLCWPYDLSAARFRREMLSGSANYVPLSSAAHTLELYRRMPEGWTPAPASSTTDLFMWRKVLSLPGLRAASTTRPTVLHFPSSHRRGWTIAERVSELEPWAARVANASRREQLYEEMAELFAARVARQRVEFGEAGVRSRLACVPVLGALARREAPRAREQ
jgi:GalNAc5-diNAcBac-PP-undecaprenol beta-1,3-glucosyltransferase